MRTENPSSVDFGAGVEENFLNPIKILESDATWNEWTSQLTAASTFAELSQPKLVPELFMFGKSEEAVTHGNP